MSVSFDDSELRAFAAELGEVSQQAARKLRPVVSKGALNIKNEMQSDMQASRHFKQIARTISYDLEDEGMTAVIGPNKHFRAARLANIAYFGVPRGGGGTVDIDRPLENEKPRFEKAVRDVLDGLL